jgi:signal transduction histidine kinase
MLREDAVIGALTVLRMEVSPFTNQQVELLETFANQAVIAIENTRLFSGLSEALEQQTATSQVLRVIASSPTDLQAVFEAVAENAARLCDAQDAQIYRVDGDRLQKMAAYGSLPIAVGVGEEMQIVSSHLSGRAVLEGRTVHIHDIEALESDEFAALRAIEAGLGVRTVLATPLLREGVAIGSIAIRRREVRPFSAAQIALLRTFADQAVIAIENTRLFTELQDRTRELARSVEELRALGEVGQTVSSSLDLQQVLGTVVSHADELSGTDGGVLYEYDETDRTFRVRATRRLDAQMTDTLRATRVRLGDGAVGRAAAARQPVQIPDIMAEGAYEARLRRHLARAGYHAILAVPLLRENRILGGLVVFRKTPGVFPPNVVELVQTFASQSALAIQNARLFREVEDKSQQLELASQHKSDFLASMSHELRTPLNAIIGFSEVLLERMFGELNEKQAEYQRDILSAGQHLLSLINDILDLSKVEAGQMEVEITSFSLRAALENGLTIVKERASRHDIALSLEVEPGLDLIVADERKVKQVVFNLLSNAVKFTPDGGRVAVTARRTEGLVAIVVQDTGIGIAPEDLEHVFDEFRQVGSGAAKSEGTGLGLALSKRFVELHGGRIWAESAPGRGSTFSFTLPRRAPAPLTQTPG